ncbi:hypothetical protein GGS21DRAFT_529438 [Xylaria nigripes]|nr:hypothetical protein GGS21DRAFT_529438 [Xylaria nigripes]
MYISFLLFFLSSISIYIFTILFSDLIHIYIQFHHNPARCAISAHPPPPPAPIAPKIVPSFEILYPLLSCQNTVQQSLQT